MIKYASASKATEYLWYEALIMYFALPLACFPLLLFVWGVEFELLVGFGLLLWFLLGFTDDAVTGVLVDKCCAAVMVDLLPCTPARGPQGRHALGV